MPDKPCVPEFGQCRSCALAGPVNGPLPTSHTEVCCLYKFQRQGQPPFCLKEKLRDGLCENCPSRLKFQQQLQDQPTPLPELPPQPRSDAEEVRAPDAGKKSGLKIAPRRRVGFKKLTIEIRPPKFKRKLWFGTYEPEDVDRAKDAINYYMGSNLPYHFSDSPSIFAQHRLSIEYRELHPSCEQFRQVGEKWMRETAVFARQVKEVIQKVTGKKRGQQRRPRSAGKNAAKKESTPEPVASCASGVTSLPCASDYASGMASEETSNVAVAAATATTYGASSSEVNSELASFTSPFESQEDDSFNLDMETYVGWKWWSVLDTDVVGEPGMDPSHFFSGGPE